MAGLMMDSHVALWMIAAPEKLSVRAAAALANGAQPLHLSVITIWEMEMKAALGKLPLPPLIWDRLQEDGIQILPVLREHALLAPRLPLLHRDPFDRMLVAQAMTDGLTLVSADRSLAAYGMPILW